MYQKKKSVEKTKHEHDDGIFDIMIIINFKVFFFGLSFCCVLRGGRGFALE